jgi:hypothetical protein
MGPLHRKLLIVIGVFVTLLIVLVVTSLNWARNPYGLEDARIGPKGTEKLPSIPLVANAKNFLLFPGHEGNTFVIHLPLPNEYIHPSNTTSRFVKSYTASATMYYPEMYSAFHPKNAHLLKCNGHCEGYIRAYIEVKENGARVQNERRLELIRKDRASASTLHSFQNLESEFGLDDHFQIRHPVIEQKSQGNKSSTKEYLFKREKNGDLKYLFECSPYAPSPGCSVRFNLSSRPEVLVDIHFGRHLMENWADIIKLVDAKIGSWKPVKVATVRDL